jgi:hypothetical protein
MMGSWLASGKIPFLPAHSMSKLKMRRGARDAQSPSGAWLIRSSMLHGYRLIMMIQDVHFILTRRRLFVIFADDKLFFRKLNPIHTGQFCIDHESQHNGHVAFKCGIRPQRKPGESDTAFDKLFNSIQVTGRRGRDF